MKYVSTKIIEANRFEWGMEDGIMHCTYVIPKDAHKYPKEMRSIKYPGYLAKYEDKLDTRNFDEGYVPYIITPEGKYEAVKEYDFIQTAEKGKIIYSSLYFESNFAPLNKNNIDQMQVVLNMLKKFDELYPKHQYHSVDIHSDGSCSIDYFLPEQRKHSNYLDWDMGGLQDLYAFAQCMMNLSDEEILEEIVEQVNERLR